jgi:hypothetical protein
MSLFEISGFLFVVCVFIIFPKFSLLRSFFMTSRPFSLAGEIRTGWKAATDKPEGKVFKIDLVGPGWSHRGHILGPDF